MTEEVPQNSGVRAASEPRPKRAASFRIGTIALIVFVARIGIGPIHGALGDSDADRKGSKIQSITEFASGPNLEKLDGFLTLYRNLNNGSLHLQIPKSGSPELLYQSILTSGLVSRDLTARGSTDALDRGYIGQTKLVVFRRFGKRVLLIQRNTTYYTPKSKLDSSDDAALSFPNSVLASFDIDAEEGDSLLIDATSFFLRDGIDVPAALKASGQGDYKFEPTRSAVDVSNAHTTVGSVEVDALLAFSNSAPPPERDIMGRVTADRSMILVHERNALVRLPDLDSTSFQPRIFDPRSGFFDNTFYDPKLLPDRATRQSFIVRHALTKKDPSESVSEPEKPIVFDAAVNIILWVPRETRGYSVGGVIADPWTGQDRY